MTSENCRITTEPQRSFRSIKYAETAQKTEHAVLCIHVWMILGLMEISKSNLTRTFDYATAKRDSDAIPYTGWSKKSKPPPIFQKNRIKDCQRD